MTPDRLIERARAVGVVLRRDGDRLIAEFEADPPSELLEELRAAKPEILAHLAGNPVEILRSQQQPTELYPGEVRLYPALRPRNLSVAPDGCWSCGIALGTGERMCSRCRHAFDLARIFPRLIVAAVSADLEPNATGVHSGSDLGDFKDF